MFQLLIGNKNYSSWSLRPWVLLKELGIPFEEQLHRFGGASWDGIRALSPTARVPLLIDGETRVWDSLAIVEYVAEAHPNVWPADKAARAWARSVAAEMHSGFSALRNACSMSVGVRIELDTMSPALAADVERIGALWTEGLDRWGGPFLTGAAFTAADAFYCPVAFRWQTYGFALPAKAEAYARRLLALPSMQAWYSAGLAEAFRDESHEVEMRDAGKWTADLRAPVKA